MFRKLDHSSRLPYMRPQLPSGSPRASSRGWGPWFFDDGSFAAWIQKQRASRTSYCEEDRSNESVQFLQRFLSEQEKTMHVRLIGPGKDLGRVAPKNACADPGEGGNVMLRLVDGRRAALTFDAPAQAVEFALSMIDASVRSMKEEEVRQLLRDYQPHVHRLLLLTWCDRKETKHV